MKRFTVTLPTEDVTAEAMVAAFNRAANLGILTPINAQAVAAGQTVVFDADLGDPRIVVLRQLLDYTAANSDEHYELTDVPQVQQA